MSPTRSPIGHLLVLGLGYCGAAVAREAAVNWRVTGTTRGDPANRPANRTELTGVEVIGFEAAESALASATHLLATAPADAHGDPVLARYCAAIAAAPALRWIGYLSSTGVYGDRGGGWVDEDTPPAPASARARRRRAAEQAWAALAETRAVDIFRLAGIYGPGRSVFDAIRAGTARRVFKAGQVFGRIHRDDIAAAVLAAMRQTRRSGVRVLNLADDLPAANAEVTEEAARLLGVPAPPAVSFAEAEQHMSETARSFWTGNRRVSGVKTQAVLGLSWRYPSYREGLRAVLEQESVERAAE